MTCQSQYMTCNAIWNPMQDLFYTLGAGNIGSSSDSIESGTQDLGPWADLVVDDSLGLRVILERHSFFGAIVGMQSICDLTECSLTVPDQRFECAPVPSTTLQVMIGTQHMIGKPTAITEDISFDRRRIPTFHCVVVHQLTHERIEVSCVPARFQSTPWNRDHQ